MTPEEISSEIAKIKKRADEIAGTHARDKVENAANNDIARAQFASEKAVFLAGLSQAERDAFAAYEAPPLSIEERLKNLENRLDALERA